MRNLITRLAAGCALAAAPLVTSIEAQSFSVDGGGETAPLAAPGSGLYFVHGDPAIKIIFASLPPAQKMFVDQTGNLALFPALYPERLTFRRLQGNAPGFFAGHFQGAFTAYRVGDYFLGLAEGYSLYSATIRDGRLFVLARDRDGDFVQLQPTHFTIFRADGTPLYAREITGQPGAISILVDRSGSMDGFDADMAAALRTLAGILTGNDTCAIYEFGDGVRTVARPGRQTCGPLLARYTMAGPSGKTPLFAAMRTAYRGLADTQGPAAVVILSDGAPSDTPAKDLAGMARQTPTFVLWVGDHTTDHIARYSTAYAIAKQATQAEIEDFLKAVSFAATKHQTFKIESQ